MFLLRKKRCVGCTTGPLEAIVFLLRGLLQRIGSTFTDLGFVSFVIVEFRYAVKNSECCLISTFLLLSPHTYCSLQTACNSYYTLGTNYDAPPPFEYPSL